MHGSVGIRRMSKDYEYKVQTLVTMINLAYDAFHLLSLDLMITYFYAKHYLFRCSVFVFFCFHLFGGSVYVDQVHGDDKANGSREHSFKTIARAVKEVDGVGGEIDLDPSGGPYYEPILIKKGGVAGNPLVVDGHGSVINLGRDVTSGPWTDTGSGFRLERPVTINPRWWLAAPVFVNGLPVFTDFPQKSINRPSAWHGGVVRYDDQGRLILVFPKGLNPNNSVVVLTGGAKSATDYMAVGCQLAGASYVQFRNIISVFSPNDGFNFHGNGHDILLDNVKGLFNGDQGTSAHFDAREFYQIDIQNSEFAFNGSGAGPISDGLGTKTNYKNVRVHQNRGYAFLFPALPTSANQQSLETQGHHILDGIVSFGNELSNLPKASVHIEMKNRQDLDQIGADRRIPIVADQNARLDPATPVVETDRLGRFLQVRPAPQ
jgi:hypothetical protein